MLSVSADDKQRTRAEQTKADETRPDQISRPADSSAWVPNHSLVCYHTLKQGVLLPLAVCPRAAMCPGALSLEPMAFLYSTRSSGLVLNSVS